MATGRSVPWRHLMRARALVATLITVSGLGGHQIAPLLYRHRFDAYGCPAVDAPVFLRGRFSGCRTLRAVSQILITVRRTV